MNSPLYILEYNSESLSPLKGNIPCKSVYKTTPKAHISALSPLYSCRVTISGAIYDGVPQNMRIFFSKGKAVENPKSINFGVYPSKRIFSNLRSLCAMDF